MSISVSSLYVNHVLASKVVISRGCSPSGDNPADDSHLRIIVWAREAVRGAKVRSLPPEVNTRT